MADCALLADRLYAVHCRPQEWDECRAAVQLTLRWHPLAEDEGAVAERQAVLVVLSAHAALPEGHPLRAAHPQGLEVLRCGWEAVLACAPPRSAAQLALPEEILAVLVQRAAALVNELAQRAGLAPLLDAATIRALLASHAGPA
ncbi:MAG: hypothetical protein RMM29_02825 [Planctomycetota bacterium]|nr:hypothetical protein [Planctomycetota bacterium]MCX8039141.1 hypothetical protein [Planctomycetota bacterium]MDW8372567.1 hypothetical protein [Planctomycetota bacterium]